MLCGTGDPSPKAANGAANIYFCTKYIDILEFYDMVILSKFID